MSLAMWRAFRGAVREIAASPEIRAVAIAGTAGAFVAGADLADFRAFASAADGLAYEAVVEDALAALEALPIATIAAISGVCTGAGVVLASACDVRVGARDARVGIPIARTVGNVTTAANVARVAAVVGVPRALAWIVTAELDDAERALACGFFHELRDTPEEVAARVDALVARIAANAPATIAAAKELVRRVRRAPGGPIDDRDLLERCYGSRDFREGVAAFLDKRAPAFDGS